MRTMLIWSVYKSPRSLAVALMETGCWPISKPRMISTVVAIRNTWVFLIAASRSSYNTSACFWQSANWARIPSADEAVVSKF